MTATQLSHADSMPTQLSHADPTQLSHALRGAWPPKPLSTALLTMPVEVSHAYPTVAFDRG